MPAWKGAREGSFRQSGPHKRGLGRSCWAQSDAVLGTKWGWGGVRLGMSAGRRTQCGPFLLWSCPSPGIHPIPRGGVQALSLQGALGWGECGPRGLGSPL